MPSLPATNLTGHWDASTSAEVYTTNNSGLPPSGNCANGDPANVWRSLINSAHLLRFPSGGGNVAPIWKNDAAMLLPSIHYDPAEIKDASGHKTQTSTGSDIAPTTFLGASAHTILISFRASRIDTSNTTAPNGNTTLLSTFWTAVSAQIREDGAASGTYSGIGTDSRGAPTWDHAGAIASPIFLATSHVICVRRDASNVYCSVDGGSESSASTNASSQDIGTAPLYIGRNFFAGGGSSQFTGRIGEVALYNAALTGTPLSDAIQYFTDKWLGGGGGGGGQTFSMSLVSP